MAFKLNKGSIQPHPTLYALKNFAHVYEKSSHVE